MKKYKVLVIGNGGREHTLSWKLSQSEWAESVSTAPGNAGIPSSIALNIGDLNSVKKYCLENKIDLVVVGPEVALSAGIVDVLREADILAFGPTKNAAMLESSKVYAKSFMAKFGVSTARSITFTPPFSKDILRAGFDSLGGKGVLKYDGLAAGKGVFVCPSPELIDDTIDMYMGQFGNSGQLVLEEYLEGYELSLIAITDGNGIKYFQPSQDHKRLLDGDRGPNTGGMGAYTPVKVCTPELMQCIEEKIVLPTLKGIKEENLDYKGFIYFGILVQNNVPYLLEYNVRMGDPETQVLLPSLKSDLLIALVQTLSGEIEQVDWRFDDKKYVGVALVSDGYPGSYLTGFEINGMDMNDDESLVFFSGVSRNTEGKLVTAGGRVLNVVASDENFETALKKVYNIIEKISFQGMKYRADIGSRNL